MADVPIGSPAQPVATALTHQLSPSAMAAQTPNSSVVGGSRVSLAFTMASEVNFADRMAEAARHGAMVRRNLRNKPRLNVFIYFPKLPPELRLMVWRFSLEPRVVEMRFANNRRSTQYDFLSRIPAVLHVSGEVRAEFLKKYKVLFDHKKCRRPAYFNSEVDTLHIRDTVRSGYQGYWHGVDSDQILATVYSMPNRSEVRHLSVTQNFWLTHGQYGNIAPPIFSFRNLETVCVSIVEEADACRHHNHSWPSRRMTSFNAFRPSESEDAKRCQDFVQQFISDHEAGRWNVTAWKVPTFEHKALCLEFLHPKRLYCPPIGLGRAQKLRDEKEERLRQQGTLLAGTSDGEKTGEEEAAKGTAKTGDPLSTRSQKLMLRAQKRPAKKSK